MRQILQGAEHDLQCVCWPQLALNATTCCSRVYLEDFPSENPKVLFRPSGTVLSSPYGKKGIWGTRRQSQKLKTGARQLKSRGICLLQASLNRASSMTYARFVGEVAEEPGTKSKSPESGSPKPTTMQHNLKPRLLAFKNSKAFQAAMLYWRHWESTMGAGPNQMSRPHKSVFEVFTPMSLKASL